MDILDRADLPLPHSLPEFQRLFPDDADCAAYLEKARWGDGFAMPALRHVLESRSSFEKPPWRPALPQVPPEHRSYLVNSLSEL